MTAFASSRQQTATQTKPLTASTTIPNSNSTQLFNFSSFTSTTSASSQSSNTVLNTFSSTRHVKRRGAICEQLSLIQNCPFTTATATTASAAPSSPPLSTVYSLSTRRRAIVAPEIIAQHITFSQFDIADRMSVSRDESPFSSGCLSPTLTQPSLRSFSRCRSEPIDLPSKQLQSLFLCPQSRTSRRLTLPTIYEDRLPTVGEGVEEEVAEMNSEASKITMEECEEERDARMNDEQLIAPHSSPDLRPTSRPSSLFPYTFESFDTQLQQRHEEMRYTPDQLMRRRYWNQHLLPETIHEDESEDDAVDVKVESSEYVHIIVEQTSTTQSSKKSSTDLELVKSRLQQLIRERDTQQQQYSVSAINDATNSYIVVDKSADLNVTDSPHRKELFNDYTTHQIHEYNSNIQRTPRQPFNNHQQQHSVNSTTAAVNEMNEIHNDIEMLKASASNNSTQIAETAIKHVIHTLPSQFQQLTLQK